MLFLKVAIPIQILTNNAQEFPFSTSLPTLMFPVFDTSHSKKCQVIYIIIHFPDDQ